MYASCPTCKSTYAVTDELEGKSLRCPQCGTVFRARLNRGAIKTTGQRAQSGQPWPSKLPTLKRQQQSARNSTWRVALATILGLLLFSGLIAALSYVYLANNPNIPNEATPSSQNDPVRTR